MSVPSGAAARRQGGFSLIEMLVGLALVSVSIALLPGSIRLGMQAWTSRGDMERVTALTMIVDAIEQRIAQSIPLVERGRDGGLRLLFSGTENSVEFIAPAMTGPLGPGLYRHRIGRPPVDEVSGGISIETALHMPGKPAWGEEAGASETTLGGREILLRYRYYGAERRSAQPAWHSAWRRLDAMPLLIEIAIEVKTGSGVHRRRSVVAPNIALQ